MSANQAFEFSIWRAQGMLLAARLHLHVRLHATHAAIGRVTALSPVQHGYLDLSHAQSCRRARWIHDLAIGSDSRQDIIRAAVLVAVRRAAAMTTGRYAIVAADDVADALNDVPLRLFGNAVEARRWLGSTTEA